jgi:molybdopterin-guanine dinucleotide biosynthesis protein A
VILAGGRGRRMGAADKGWVEFEGRALIEHVIARFAPQVDELLISANRNLERYAALGCPVVPDLLPDYPGPLAGLQAALQCARYDLIATAPCDSPFLPMDLVERLSSALERSAARIAVPRAGGRLQPVFLLCRKSVAPELDRYLASGGRKVEAWCTSLHCVEVDLESEAEAMRNLNTPEELAGPS